MIVGLKGSIKSMIVAHSFENFKEMYQRAVKLAGCWKKQTGKTELLTWEKERLTIIIES